MLCVPTLISDVNNRSFCFSFYYSTPYRVLDSGIVDFVLSLLDREFPSNIYIYVYVGRTRQGTTFDVQLTIVIREFDTRLHSIFYLVVCFNIHRKPPTFCQLSIITRKSLIVSRSFTTASHMYYAVLSHNHSNSLLLEWNEKILR